MDLLFVTCTDPGGVRQQNEDYAGYAGNDAFGVEIFCVADGMGGHGYGEVASRTVVEALLTGFQGLKGWDPKHVDKTLADLFSNAQQALHALEDEEFIATVIASSSVFQARDYLLKQAYANGAADNITFQIIKPCNDAQTVS